MINSLFPAKLLPVMLSLGGSTRTNRSMPYRKRSVSTEELITHFPFTVTGTQGFREAIITQVVFP